MSGAAQTQISFNKNMTNYSKAPSGKRERRRKRSSYNTKPLPLCGGGHLIEDEEHDVKCGAIHPSNFEE